MVEVYKPRKTFVACIFGIWNVIRDVSLRTGAACCECACVCVCVC